MTVENISQSISPKECCPPWWGSNPHLLVSSRTRIQLSHRGRALAVVVKYKVNILKVLPGELWWNPFFIFYFLGGATKNNFNFYRPITNIFQDRIIMKSFSSSLTLPISYFQCALFNHSPYLPDNLESVYT